MFGFSFLDHNADHIQRSLVDGVEPTLAREPWFDRLSAAGQSSWSRSAVLSTLP